MKLFPRPIEIRFPIEWRALEAFLGTFHRRDYWLGQPAELQTGYDSWLDDGDIRMNVWSQLDDLTSRHGGKHSSRVDIALAPDAGVAPDGYYYAEHRTDFMIGGDYLCAAPDLVVEVLSAPSRWSSPRPRVSQLAGDVDQTEVGKFQLTRQGRLVFLDVRIDGERHREILTAWADRKAWDWGE